MKLKEIRGVLLKILLHHQRFYNREVFNLMNQDNTIDSEISTIDTVIAANNDEEPANDDDDDDDDDEDDDELFNVVQNLPGGKRKKQKRGKILVG